MKRTLAFVLLAIFGSAVIGYAFYLLSAKSQSRSLYLQNKNYALQTALFDTYKTEHADIVMLGNSLTQWVDWNELLGRTNVANRGIAGDITEGYLQRLHQVYALTPKLCFIEGGINDLYANVPIDAVFAHYAAIIDSIRSHKIIPIIQSTLFVSTKWHHAVEKNKEVAELNDKLNAYATRHNVEFLDLNARMSANNLLSEELTHDGVHLTAAGYAIWGEEVSKALQRHNL